MILWMIKAISELLVAERVAVKRPCSILQVQVKPLVRRVTLIFWPVMATRHGPVAYRAKFGAGSRNETLAVYC